MQIFFFKIKDHFPIDLIRYFEEYFSSATTIVFFNSASILFRLWILHVMNGTSPGLP